MSQELHVLRPARFFTGAFTRAIQALSTGLGARAVIIGAPQMTQEQADDLEGTLVHLARKHSGSNWDCGPDAVGFSGQLGFAQWHHARAFAAYQDHPFPRFLGFGRHPFDKGFHPHEHPALVRALESRKTSFPNLVRSNDNNGFFFPVAIPFPVQTRWGYLGSSLGLATEVQRLEQLLRGGGYWHADLERVVEFLTAACASSATLQLPIVIDG